MTEQPTGGGAAFWAARGVRIEPEIVGDEIVDGESVVDEAVDSEIVDDEIVDDGQVLEEELVERAEARPEEAESGRGPEAADEVVPEASVVEKIGAVEEVGAVEDVAEVEDVREVVEETPLPEFPQQRVPETVAERDESEDRDGPESGEPAWQLTGGELALPLPPLKTCVEAILMVVDEPTSVVTLAQVLERPTVEVAEALTALAEEYTVQGRGFELREVGIGGDAERTGWRVYSRAECAPVVERFVRDGQQAKLTQAALETLAVVAYREPVSRSKISAIRGVNCDGVMRTLLARGLVEEHGNDLETGAVLYQTTGYFLERMGLKSLDELPELAPLLPGAVDVDIEDFA